MTIDQQQLRRLPTSDGQVTGRVRKATLLKCQCIQLMQNQ